MIVGLISDTHGLLREEALAALRGSDLIIHAGDVGKPEILDRLRTLAPVVAVKGNIDKGSSLPATADVHAGGVRIHVLHDVHDLRNSGFDIVVSGHSHKPSRTERDGVLYINPGAAGPLRFRLPVTVARLDLGKTPWDVQFIQLI